MDASRRARRIAWGLLAAAGLLLLASLEAVTDVTHGRASHGEALLLVAFAIPFTGFVCTAAFLFARPEGTD